ncbi:MAG TPA: glutathione S-transferase family protein [Sphingomicrobium sp.]|nr:glutathione S-transferase family protein [Sphingomicrobium sp.]
MADLIFYTNPQWRGRTVRWMLEEIGVLYETEVLTYDQMKSERYLAIHPLGKVPAIVHADQIVTETAAICAYLADAFAGAELGPRAKERADYYRWLFYAAGPLEMAILNEAVGWRMPPEQERMFGYGNFNKAIGALDLFLSNREYVCFDRFTAADVYLGSLIMSATQFGMLPERNSFLEYCDRLQQRDAYKRASEIDEALTAEMQRAAGAETA